MSILEQDAWEQGDDPCIHIMRLYESTEQMEAVEDSLP